MKNKLNFGLMILGAVIFFLSYFLINVTLYRMIVCAVGVALVCINFYIVVSADSGKKEDEDTEDDDFAMTDEELGDFLTKDGEYDENEEDLFCDDCGAVRKPGWYFCPECGYKYNKSEEYCTNCRELVNENWDYCVKCGKNLGFENQKEIKDDLKGVDYDRPCPRCKHFYLPEWNFCPTCGLDFKANNKRCPSCSTPASDGWDFCANCGHAINE